jgi:tRNA(Ile)-lysidine synthase
VWRPIAANDPRVGRFRAELEALTGTLPTTRHRLGLAISGGPDSTALLLLAAAACPGGVAAVTVDHGLRAESATEANQVAAICANLGVPHETLMLAWDVPPRANLQALARERRYQTLAAWAQSHGCGWLAVAHHIDDQAETLLMRLARGSGVGGAAGVRPTRRLAADGLDCGPVQLVRPLLGWRRHDLVALVEDAGIVPVDDPANRDARHDRSRVRQTLADTPWLAPERLAAAAAHFAEAEEALDWISRKLWSERAESNDDGVVRLDVAGLPRELQRRLVTRAIGVVARAGDVPGPKLVRLLDALLAGRVATVAGVRCSPGPRWVFAPAPARRSA